MRALDRFWGWIGGRRAAISPTVRIDQVAPWLLIGPEPTPAAYADLVARGVTHVLDLREEATDDPTSFEPLGIRWRRVAVPDRHAPTDEQLAEIAAWLDAELDREAGQTVYLHCHAGLGRTPTVAIALLMHQQLSLQEAHRLVLAARPESSPTSRQLAWLEALEARLGAQRG